MKSAEVIILGAGIIGLSLALELRRTGASVLVLEKSEPGREASYAAAGMLAPWGGDLPPSLQSLAEASAKVYPDFVLEIEDASGLKADLRSEGTILIPSPQQNSALPPGAAFLREAELTQLEPSLARHTKAFLIEERSVDPRALVAGTLKAALHHGVEVASGAQVQAVNPEGNVLCVSTAKTRYHANTVVNCCGAWAGQILPLTLPARPVKGQMLSVSPHRQHLITHVVRAESIYMVPRSSGLILIGATVEDAGFDKQVNPETIAALQQAANNLVPELADARLHEAWAGLRPATADDLPIMGETSIPGYFVATGHFRNGILLAPITAQVMAQMIQGKPPDYDLSAFSPTRFAD